MKLLHEVARFWRIGAIAGCFCVLAFAGIQLVADDSGPFAPDIPDAPAVEKTDGEPVSLDERLEITVTGGIRSSARTEHSTSVAVRNISDEDIDGPLALVVDAAGLDELTVVEFDGKLASGEPYLELLDADATLRAGVRLRPKRVQFESEAAIPLNARRAFAPEFRVVRLTDEDQAEETVDGDEDNLPGKSYSQADMDRVMKIQENWTVRLMQMARGDVYGTAVSEDDQGHLVVRVYTSRPGIIRQLPGEVDGITLQQHVTGDWFHAGPTTSQVIYKDGKAVNTDGDGKEETKTDPGLEPLPDESPDMDESAEEEPIPVQGALPATDEPEFTGTPGDPTVRFDRPVPIGVSSFNLDMGVCATGTLGCRLVDPTGVEFALSNNHVWGGYLAIVPNPQTGDPLDAVVALVGNPGDVVVQPGPLDTDPQCTFEPLDQIGIVSDYQPILLDTLPNILAGIAPENFMDATIMEADPGAVHYCTPPDGYGAPRRDIATARIGMEVQKYGRTTIYTSQGTINSVNAATAVIYAPNLYGYFIKQVELSVNVPFGYPFGGPGDSGSLIVVKDPGGPDDRKPVALLFAGGGPIPNGDLFTVIANPIGPVLTRFGMTVDDGSGAPGTGGVSGTSGGAVGPLDPPSQF